MSIAEMAFLLHPTDIIDCTTRVEDHGNLAGPGVREAMEVQENTRGRDRRWLSCTVDNSVGSGVMGEVDILSLPANT
jgi:hypothetical protein